MAGSSATRSTRTRIDRTQEEMIIIRARVEHISAQRRSQIEEIGPPIVDKLGDCDIVTPRYIDMELYIHVKLPGIGKLLHQDWETVYIIAQKEVHVPLIKEFYDCARRKRSRTITTRVNNNITTFTVHDVVAALYVNLKDGER